MRYPLIPFQECPYDLQIEVELRNIKSVFSIDFSLTGDLSQIEGISESAHHNLRADELWKSTCFEWFLKLNPEQNKNYWEFNAAPDGRWNFYELEDYRKNLRPSFLIHAPEFRSSQEKNQYYFQMECPLQVLLDSAEATVGRSQLALTAVIRWKTGETSYFSLKHPLEKPDFHDPIGFQLTLPQEAP